MAYWLSTTTPTSGSDVPELRGRLDPLVSVAGRHPDVGDDHVGMFCLDRGEQGVEVDAHRDHLDVCLRVEQPSHAFADEVVILREHHPDRHMGTIRP